MIGNLKTKSEFTRNVLTLMTGTVVAQAIPIAISPILTRIYSPEEFGLFALFFAILSILSVLANGRYENAVMLPKKDSDAINIFALGFIINTFLSLFLLVIVVLFNDDFTRLLGNDDIAIWLYFIPIALFFTGLFNILNSFNNRQKNYKDIADAMVMKSMVLAVVQILNKGRSPCGAIMKLMRRLVIVAAMNNFHFMALHVAGYKNSIADSLSRLNFQKFRRLAPDAAPHPCVIPSEVMFL